MADGATTTPDPSKQEPVSAGIPADGANAPATTQDPPKSNGATTTEGQQAGSTGAGEARASAADAGEIQVVLPEGIERNEEVLKQFTGMAREIGLNSESAQKVMDFYLAEQKRIVDVASARWEKQTQDWVAAVKADPEIGGEDFEKRVAAAKQFVDRHGTPELLEFLDHSMLGNHPELVRLFYRAARATGEDTIAGSSAGSSGGGAKTDDEKLAARYPSMVKNN